MRTTLSVGALMDIVVWLRSLGLGKYEAAFRENEIDETVLPEPDAREPEGAWRHALSGTGASCSMPSLLCVPMRACRLHQSRQHPRGHRLRRQLPRPSQKPLASADMSR